MNGSLENELVRQWAAKAEHDFVTAEYLFELSGRNYRC